MARIRVGPSGAITIFDALAEESVEVLAPSGEYMVIRHERDDGSVEIVVVQEGPKVYGGAE